MSAGNGFTDADTCSTPTQAMTQCADSRPSASFFTRPVLCIGRPDCGAGIGRVTKHLLLDRFDSVDIVEQSPRLLQAAPKYIGRDRDRTTCVCVGLQVRARLLRLLASCYCWARRFAIAGWVQAAASFRSNRSHLRIALGTHTVAADVGSAAAVRLCWVRTVTIRENCWQILIDRAFTRRSWR